MDTIEIQRVVEIEDDNWWYRERREIVARELRRTGATGRAVDIGAAGGGNTRVLLDHGWKATAVDNTEAAVDLCLSQGLDACYADARFLPLPSAEFDLALALNVLEHIEDDAAAAAEIARVLRPGGAVLVSVPCDMRLWSTHDVALGRVRRYTRASLAETLTDAGLVVDRIWSWNVLVRPFVRLRRHRIAHCEDMAHLHPALNESLSLLASLERRLPLKSWPGVSLFARAYQPAE
ncbi:class I SAM-dependent methyltransferase [Actinomadura barringtoniae]|uniref:Class I SAM-dependent methyltransferase n=1 Tax=Actinomadura barringtoniae TaxID=1427535 RepID=A0A939TDC3_9ACTN|nr:class I SAM-dependent methyltransferase [Actinomadura barringtoniae]MBO2452155.1 class I SAM-dependent methyltransferase [Actinomadura barringtoniae]